MLTVQERKLCEILEDGFFARSKRGRLIFHKYKPVKNEELGIWMTNGYRTGIFNSYPHIKFDFISWEDAEPYSIKDLLELPVDV